MSARLSQGRLVALGVVGLALAATVGALVYRRSRVTRPLAFWGHQAAHLIAYAPRVELLRLVPSSGEGATSDDEPFRFAGRAWHIAHRRDVTGARGLVHIRRALLDTGAYAWDAPAEGGMAPAWHDALRFEEGGRRAVVLMDFDVPRWQAEGWRPRLGLADTDRAADIAPAAAGLRQFIEEQQTP